MKGYSVNGHIYVFDQLFQTDFHYYRKIFNNFYIGPQRLFRSLGSLYAQLLERLVHGYNHNHVLIKQPIESC